MVTFKVPAMDYNMLMANESLLEEIRSSLIQGIVQTSGVPADNVHLTLYAGSVVGRAVIDATDTLNTNDIQISLESAAVPLRSDLASRLQYVDGIEALISVSVPELQVTTVTLEVLG